MLLKKMHRQAKSGSRRSRTFQPVHPGTCNLQPTVSLDKLKLANLCAEKSGTARARPWRLELQICVIEARELLQALPIQYLEMPAGPDHHFFAAKTLQATVHVDNRKAGSVGKLDLGNRQEERTVRLKFTKAAQTSRHLAKEMGKLVPSATLADVEQPLPHDGDFDQSRANECPFDVRVICQNSFQLVDRNGCHFCTANERDVMVAAVRNEELGIADVARKEKAEDLTSTIWKKFIAESDARQDQKYGEALMAFVNHILIRAESSAVAANDVKGVDIAAAEVDQLSQFLNDCVYRSEWGQWSNGAPGDKTGPR